MSAPVDFTTALSRLLAEPRLRREFAADPEGTALLLAGQGPVRHQLLNLSADAVEAQAHGLLMKRFHAVQELLPRTFMRLGPEALCVFGEYAESRWPQGHLRHLVDAHQFSEFLRRGYAEALDAAEANRAAFHLSRCRIGMYWAHRTFINGRYRRALQLLYRRRGQVRQVLWFAGL